MTNPVLPPPLKPLRPAPDTDPLPRIEALTRNARTTWFALLGALVFVGVTLLGVEHIDFWGVNRATQLPLVNVSVPTRLFFAAAPILTAAIYAYFHVYLIRLWEALGEAPSQIKGQPLGNAVTPWLVSDAALYVRKISRRETPSCLPNRALDLPAALLNLALAWAFGLVVLWLAWRWSFPARDLYLSTAAGFSLAAAAVAGFNSLMVMLGRMSQLGTTGPIYRLGFSALLVAGLFSFAGYESWEKTSGPIDKLAPLSLVDAEIVERPEGWTDREYARRDFLAVWCQREGPPDCPNSGVKQDEFEREWAARREAVLITLVKPDPNHVRIIDAHLAVALTDADNFLAFLGSEDRIERAAGALAPFRASALNLRKADLRSAFLAGLDLTVADLTGAQLQGARMEEAELFGAILDGANLAGAVLQKADLSWASLEQKTNLADARLEGAFMMGSQLNGAFAVGAQMDNAALFWAQISEADLRGSSLRGANLSWANLERTDFSSASLEKAILREARMEGANFSRSRMEAANLFNARMEGADFREARLEGANLRGARLEGADLGFARLKGTDLRLAQLEGANFWGAPMEGALLTSANMEGAVLGISLLSGGPDQPTRLRSTNLNASTYYGGALRFVDLTEAIFNRETDWRNVFLDGSVEVTRQFRARAGNPCQWTDAELTDQAFYGRWRWWHELQPGDNSAWVWLVPEAYRDVPVNPGPTNCFWKTGPMNGPR